MLELYKGYTQHLVSNKIDDETPGAILRMEMIPGLYVMKNIQQEGYALPVCKYINNLRTDIVSYFPVNTPGKCQHPRFDYVSIDADSINMQTCETLPTTLSGGIAIINNLMQTRTISRYNDLTKGNLLELETQGYIVILRCYVNIKAQAFVLLIKHSCDLVCENISYNFNVIERDNTIVDFEASVK